MQTKIYEVFVGYNDLKLGVFQGKIDEIALFLGGNFPNDSLKFNEIRPQAPGCATCSTAKVEISNPGWLKEEDFKSENYITDLKKMPGRFDITYKIVCENHKDRIRLNKIMSTLSDADREFLESQL